MRSDSSAEKAKLILDTLFLKLASSELSSIIDRSAIEWVTDWLKLDPLTHFDLESLQHLLAIQLAPLPALNYDVVDPMPRWRHIDNYLSERFGFLEKKDRELLARLVAIVLDRADIARSPGAELGDFAERMCRICHLPFDCTPESVLTRDPYKPIWQAYEELTRPEIDHIVPVSGLGTNDPGNLQLVCRACNLAKHSSLELHPRAEIVWAGSRIADVPRMHLLRMLQWLIRRTDGRCLSCGMEGVELTMRPEHPRAPLVRTSMRVTCYSCTHGM